MVRQALASAVVIVLTATLANTGTPYAAAASAPWPPKPVISARTVGDPAVTATPRGLVLTATGNGVARATSKRGTRWKWLTPALASRPAWVSPAGGEDWAPDLVKVGGSWLLFYAAPVAGLRASSRCIGVARAARPTGKFVPVGAGPLVCPTTAQTPPAPDQMIDPVPPAEPTDPTGPPAQPSTPPHVLGAIDPSFFHDDRTGQNWLLYKSDGLPSAIRLVPLSADGTQVVGASKPLITAPGVIENPVVVQSGSTYFLFASMGGWSRCTYRTVWMSSPDLGSWSGAPQELLTSASTGGLCGPGGLDVVATRRGLTAYFAAWTCRPRRSPCPPEFVAVGGDPALRGMRSLYGVRLSVASGQPVLGRWLRPGR